MTEEWAFLMQAFNDLEAEIVCGLLREASIPVRRKDSDPLAGAMRVVGGQAYEIDILVPRQMLPQARALLDAVRRGSATEKEEK
ncbi:putative signal transducing protein [Candidatus Darwinibacter acetoxidans]